MINLQINTDSTSIRPKKLETRFAADCKFEISGAINHSETGRKIHQILMSDN